MTNVQLGQPVWSRADARFFWNRDVVVDLIACNADEWITPVMSGKASLQFATLLESLLQHTLN
jgi:hypothetical protein